MGELRRAAEQVRKEIEAAQLDKARFSVAEKETQEFNMENGEFSLYRTLFDKELSVSIREPVQVVRTVWTMKQSKKQWQVR